MKRTIQHADTGNRQKRICAGVLSETEETSVVSSNIAHNDTCKLFLRGVRMYILVAGIGKIRAELFHKQLEMYGGDVSTTYAPGPANTTHILVDEKMDAQRMCRIMKLDKPPHPDDVVIVTSLWLSSCLKTKERVSTEKFQLDLNSFESVFKSNLHNNNPPMNKEQRKCYNKEQKAAPRLSIPQNSRAAAVPSTSTENNTEVWRKVPKVGMMFNAFTKRGVKNSSGEDSDYEPSGGEEDKEDCVRHESTISEPKNLPVSVPSSSVADFTSGLIILIKLV